MYLNQDKSGYDLKKMPPSIAERHFQWEYIGV